jgi:hypothetical protein
MITAATFVKSERLSPGQYRVFVSLVTDDTRGTFEDSLMVSGLKPIAQITAYIESLDARFATEDAFARMTPGTAIPIAAAAPTQLEQRRTAAMNRVREMERLQALSTIPGFTLPKTVAAAVSDANTALALAPDNATRLAWLIGR